MYLEIAHAGLLLFHTVLTRLGFKFTNHQRLSDLFSEYLLPSISCRTTETIESVEISMDQSKLGAAFEGEIIIAT